MLRAQSLAGLAVGAVIAVTLLARRAASKSVVTCGPGRLKIVIGNRAYSSWSLRAWLVLKVAAKKRGFGFEELQVDLAGAGNDDAKRKLQQYSPTGKVPALRDEDRELTVWDSLAIAEYVGDLFPETQLWPSDPTARAVARAASAEMHSGFSALRGAMPMNTRRSAPGEGMKEGVEADIRRMCELWDECRAVARDRGCAGSGPFLFGDFSIADAMFAPVVLRFQTYEPELPASAQDYCTAILAMPEVREWCEAAERESHRIEQYEKAQSK